MATRGKRRSVWIVAALAFLAAGFFCLNFTKAFGVEHHVAWAQEHGLPAPSYPIFLAGVLLVAAGGTLLGRGLSP